MQDKIRFIVLIVLDFILTLAESLSAKKRKVNLSDSLLSGSDMEIEHSMTIANGPKDIECNLDFCNMPEDNHVKGGTEDIREIEDEDKHIESLIEN